MNDENKDAVSPSRPLMGSTAVEDAIALLANAMHETKEIEGSCLAWLKLKNAITYLSLVKYGLA